MDEFAAANPNPGRRTFQRLNRPEYERAIADLLDLDVDAATWLPLDQKSANFDNIADEQGAVADAARGLPQRRRRHQPHGGRRPAGAPRVDVIYTNPSYVSQHPWDHVEGAPYGTRGGMVVNHVFPADAEYEFELLVISGDNARGEDIDVSIDGQRVALHQVRDRAGGGGRRPRRVPRSAPNRSWCAPASTRWRRRSSSAPTARTKT